MEIREFKEDELPEMIDLWNSIVSDANAFPQEEELDINTGKDFFNEQSFTAVAEEDGKVLGLYILHPNNVGRCSHIANCSYAVLKEMQGKHIGEKLVKHSIEKAKELNFLIIQFNAVLEGNEAAKHLYEKIGFKKLGTIPNGFRLGDGSYDNICIYYIEL